MPTLRAVKKKDKNDQRHGTCRLLIKINGVLYTLDRLKSHPGGWKLVKQDRVNNPSRYDVLPPFGTTEATCSCPDNSAGRRCKHIAARSRWACSGKE